MTVAYLSHFDYIASPAGLEYASLLGNSLRLSSAVVAGATSLPVVSNTTVQLNQFDAITIYDGPLSEQVLVASATAPGAGSIPIMAPFGVPYTGLMNDHTQYAPCSSPGTQGDLGTEILKASAWIENVTKQSLWQTTQTENLKMPTMRASLDNQGALNFRTRQYPITAISSLYLGVTLATLQQYDQTQCVIDVNELVNVPQLVPVGSGNNSSAPHVLSPVPFSRRANAWCQVTYTAGYTAATMPSDIKDAGVLRTSALLSRRQNPTGADGLDFADKKIQATQRGDSSPYSLLSKEAQQILSNYSLRIF